MYNVHIHTFGSSDRIHLPVFVDDKHFKPTCKDVTKNNNLSSDIGVLVDLKKVRKISQKFSKIISTRHIVDPVIFFLTDLLLNPYSEFFLYYSLKQIRYQIPTLTKERRKK
jgi:hypothetical protein